MNLAPTDYLLIWALIVTAVVVPFFFRKRQAPTRLNLDASAVSPDGKKNAGGPAQLPGARPGAAEHAHPSAKSPRGNKPPPPPPPSQQPPPPRVNRHAVPECNVEKSLNVFFQWNGHAWDAYEVLGLPAGSSLESVRLTYQKLMTQGDQEQLLFFKAAFEAIVRTRPPSA